MEIWELCILLFALLLWCCTKVSNVDIWTFHHFLSVFQFESQDQFKPELDGLTPQLHPVHGDASEHCRSHKFTSDPPELS